jgi:hypothetical protein
MPDDLHLLHSGMLEAPKGANAGSDSGVRQLASRGNSMFRALRASSTVFTICVA